MQHILIINHLSSVLRILYSVFCTPLHLSRTLYKSALFMQNKPNVKDAQINVNSYMKSKYEKLDTWLRGKNKPNSNPIKPNLRKAKMNVNLTLTKDYIKYDDFVVRINKPNFRNGRNERKLNFNKGLQKKRLFSIPKNKPNSNPIQTQSKPVLSAPVLSKVEGVEWANFFKGQNERKIGCIHISKKYNVLIRKLLDSQTYFVVKNRLY